MNKNLRVLFKVVFGLCILSIYGCATGARVVVNDQDMGSTPAVVCLEKGKTYKIVLQRGGDEEVMNINVKTDLSYRPNFFGAAVIVNMENGTVVHGTETIDELGNLTFQREINIHIPQDKDSVVVKFLTEDNLPLDVLNEKFVKTWLSGCQGKNGRKNIPLLLPLQQADERRLHEDNI
ncbi:MAG TPA: PEGA domain-containing protein [Nitrospirae bacterium]|nr:PEGA domain-containing protein [Nitrospirota bacterium]